MIEQILKSTSKRDKQILGIIFYFIGLFDTILLAISLGLSFIATIVVVYFILFMVSIFSFALILIMGV
jgi:hypothetical protein